MTWRYPMDLRLHLAHNPRPTECICFRIGSKKRLSVASITSKMSQLKFQSVGDPRPSRSVNRSRTKLLWRRTQRPTCSLLVGSRPFQSRLKSVVYVYSLLMFYCSMVHSILSAGAPIVSVRYYYLLINWVMSTEWR